ncbi:MAG: peptide ABC transporter substrate-binding protein [Cyanobacteria bacterium QS_8_64_29]|nr:MAG: peptide ABC transporter substrate-binding protein [Cyanobacteria bacterium QS_8_64_29]
MPVLPPIALPVTRLRSLGRRAIAALVALGVAIGLGGCNPAILDGRTGESRQLVKVILSNPKTFNAILSKESPNVFGYTYQGLVEENPIKGEIEPALAQSWQIAEGGQRVTFVLREGLKWSDGESLTARDVAFTFNDLIFNEAIPNNLKDSFRIGPEGQFPQVRALDERRIEFRLPEPFAPLLRSLGVPIMPAHALRASVTQTDEQGRPQFLSKWGIDTPPGEIVVNGPYQLARYATNERVVFERNPHYWETDEQGNPLPRIERVVWAIVGNQNTQLLRFRAGDLDAMGVSPEFFALLKQQAAESDYRIYNGGPDYGTRFISFNLNQGRRNGEPLIDPVKSAWFNTLNFRKAVAYAIDRQQLINTVYRGLGAKQNSPISVQSPYYNDSVKSYGHAPDRARTLLREAGFQYDSEGKLRDAEGNRVRFTLITNAGNKTREAMAAQIEQDLAQIGMRVDLNPIEFNVLVNKLSNTLDWECHLLGFTGGNEPNAGASIWFTDGRLHSFNQKPQAGQQPLQGRQVADWEKQIERLYIRAAQTLDEAERKALYARAQQIVQQKLPYIYLVNPLAMHAVRDRVRGIDYSALGGPFWNLEYLTLSPD